MHLDVARQCSFIGPAVYFFLAPCHLEKISFSLAQPGYRHNLLKDYV